MANSRLCSVPDCGKPVKANGLCRKHDKRRWKHGDPLHETSNEKTAAFIKKSITHQSDECLIWPYGKNKAGYGRLTHDGKTRLANRVVCEMVNGAHPIDRDDAAHLCGVPSCINPRHLSWKSPLGNAEDRFLHGTHLQGQYANGAKLTDKDVIQIRSLVGIKQKVVAELYGVTVANVSAIIRRTNWRWLA